MEKFIKDLTSEYYTSKSDNELTYIYNTCNIFSPVLLDDLLDGKCFVQRDKINFNNHKNKYVMIEDIARTCKKTCFNLIHSKSHSIMLYVSDSYFTVIDPSGTVRDFQSNVEILKKEIGLPYVEILDVQIQKKTKDYFCGIWNVFLAYIICRFELDPKKCVKNLPKTKKELDIVIKSFIIYLYEILKDMQMFDIAEELSQIRDDYGRGKIYIKGIRLHSEIDRINKLIIAKRYKDAEKIMDDLAKKVKLNPVWNKLPEVSLNCKTFLCKLHNYCKDEDVYFNFLQDIDGRDDVWIIIEKLDKDDAIIDEIGEERLKKFMKGFLRVFYPYGK